ncbi:MAG TPA: bile acid:sodium symporter family protein [Phnomibacter sp.]|nr:bile acid:sodium symporter family protein [Phnomibacter sp.]
MLKKFAFTWVVLVAVSLAIIFPDWFLQVGPFPLKKLIIPLLQVIMFGMGATMSFAQFVQIIKQPRAVIIGLACQLCIMPLVGLAVAKGFGFEASIAAGIVLIGCSPSGLASNVMAYIARANVPLSITITTVATLLAPITTPLLMRLLAGQFIAINVYGMLWDIVQMIILPVAAGLLLNYILPTLVKKLNKVLPIISMAGIALIMAIITASGRSTLFSIGFSLVLAVLIHNLAGYCLGYFFSRLLRQPAANCRTIALEVGLQNAGLASGLALQMGKEATVGVAAALFGPIMNTTGSLLASWWSRKQPENRID